MASSSSLFGLVFLFALLSVAIAGRPCKTLLIAYSISTSEPANDFSGRTISRFSSSFTVFSYYDYRHGDSGASVVKLGRTISIGRPRIHHQPALDSLLDRARDVLGVVSALLFGLGCGLLVSAMMYLIRSLAAGRLEMYGDDSDSDGEGSEEENRGKFGYIKVEDGPYHSPAKVGYGGN